MAGEIKKITMVQAINDALSVEMERDPDVVLIGEDVGVDGGVFRASNGLVEKFGTDRVIDTPLSELGIVGSAIGMAAYGLKPVAEIQFMAFIYEALEQVYSHAARLRMRSRGRFTCPMVIRTPYGIGIKAPELHSESSEAILCHMPGIKVVVPSTPYNAKGLLAASIRDPNPVLFLEPARLYRAVKTTVPAGEYTIPLGKAEIYQEGKDVTVVAWGTMLHRAADATEGLSVEVIDLMTLRPFDEETVLNSVKKTGRLVIVHEATKYCGLGAEISAFIAENAIMHLKAPILRVAAPDAPVPMARLEDFFMPTVERIRQAYEEILKY